MFAVFRTPCRTLIVEWRKFVWMALVAELRLGLLPSADGVGGTIVARLIGLAGRLIIIVSTKGGMPAFMIAVAMARSRYFVRLKAFTNLFTFIRSCKRFTTIEISMGRRGGPGIRMYNADIQKYSWLILVPSCAALFPRSYSLDLLGLSVFNDEIHKLTSI